MPTYQYRCTECGNDLEVVQKFTDPSLTQCPSCRGALRKVYNAVGVVFKGSGFYKTDSRANGTSKNSSRSSGEDGGAAEGTTPAKKTSEVTSEPSSPTPPATGQTNGASGAGTTAASSSPSGVSSSPTKAAVGA